MTDNEIVKALECCTNEHLGCEDGCPYADVGCYDEDGFLTIPMKDALDLINRQKAEIENLNIELQAMRGAANSYKAEIERKDIEIDILIKKKEALRDEVEELRKGITADMDYFESEYDSKMKAEAIREFAEKLKEKIYSQVTRQKIDYTVEEMVGD